MARKNSKEFRTFHGIHEVSTPRVADFENETVMMWIWFGLAVLLVFTFIQKR